MQRTLLALTEEVAAKLRRRGLAARTVNIKLRLAPFETLTRRQTVEAELDTTEAIYPIARQLLAAADPGDRPIRLVGVGVSGLHVHGSGTQLKLFEEGQRDERDHRLADVIDDLSERFGRDALRRGRLIGNDDEEEQT